MLSRLRRLGKYVQMERVLFIICQNVFIPVMIFFHGFLQNKQRTLPINDSTDYG